MRTGVGRPSLRFGGKRIAEHLFRIVEPSPSHFVVVDVQCREQFQCRFRNDEFIVAEADNPPASRKLHEHFRAILVAGNSNFDQLHEYIHSDNRLFHVDLCGNAIRPTYGSRKYCHFVDGALIVQWANVAKSTYPDFIRWCSRFGFALFQTSRRNLPPILLGGSSGVPVRSKHDPISRAVEFRHDEVANCVWCICKTIPSSGRNHFPF